MQKYGGVEELKRKHCFVRSSSAAGYLIPFAGVFFIHFLFFWFQSLCVRMWLYQRNCANTMCMLEARNVTLLIVKITKISMVGKSFLTMFSRLYNNFYIFLNNPIYITT